jgi:hypothetical protein
VPAPRKYPPELRERAQRLVRAREQEPAVSLNAVTHVRQPANSDANARDFGRWYRTEEIALLGARRSQVNGSWALGSRLAGERGSDESSVGRPPALGRLGEQLVDEVRDLRW